VETYEILVIGSGEAGKYLAWTMAKAGRLTALVERALIGGSCPNIACLPSKNVVHSAKVTDLLRRASEFGISTGPVGIDMAGVRRRKRKMVDDLVAIHLANFKASGAELILGEAKFVAPKTVEVRMKEGATRLLTGDRVFLSVGSRAAVPDVPGLHASHPLTHVEALELDRLPEHLVVLGGGYVGMEFAQAMRRFGSRVTIVERGPQLAGREDSDVSEALMQLFRDEGIDVLVETELIAVEGLSGRQVRLQVRDSRGTHTLEATDILVATGRLPNTEALGLDIAGVALDDRGYIRVDERLQTTAPGIWAMGDCAGSPQFTHVAFDDFRVVRDNLLGGNRSTTGRLLPSCLFTDPELARVGFNETEARQRAVPYRLAKVPIASVLRTRTLSETRGFLKALIAPDSGQILGFTAFGVDAGEMMAVVQTAMMGKLPYTALRHGVFTHPTMAEGMVVLFSSPLHAVG
jgi:pyruvate/2-oxoglutarate dehydrogenase complex dihydrolipoamide dehydrogenase (E3) component